MTTTALPDFQAAAERRRAAALDRYASCVRAAGDGHNKFTTAAAEALFDALAVLSKTQADFEADVSVRQKMRQAADQAKGLAMLQNVAVAAGEALRKFITEAAAELAAIDADRATLLDGERTAGNVGGLNDRCEAAKARLFDQRAAAEAKFAAANAALGRARTAAETLATLRNARPELAEGLK